jgi:hypothetical protein
MRLVCVSIGVDAWAANYAAAPDYSHYRIRDELPTIFALFLPDQAANWPVSSHDSLNPAAHRCRETLSYAYVSRNLFVFLF